MPQSLQHGLVRCPNHWLRPALRFAFIVVVLDWKKLIRINVITNPIAEWIACQLIKPFPWDKARRHLIRDQDRVYGAVVARRLRARGFRGKPIAGASPWQNGITKRLIGSIRRECVDHIAVWGEEHLRQSL